MGEAAAERLTPATGEAGQKVSLPRREKDFTEEDMFHCQIGRQKLGYMEKGVPKLPRRKAGQPRYLVDADDSDQ